VVIDHRRQGLQGLVSMFGVRYTTARQTAAHAVNAVFQSLGTRVPPPCRTSEMPVHGGAIGNIASFLRAVELRRIEGVPPETLVRLAATYGTQYDHILEVVRDIPSMAAPLSDGCAVTGAEVYHAARSEGAVTLADIVLRRTDAGAAGNPGEEALTRAAAIAASMLGWDPHQTQQEIANVEKVYGWEGKADAE
jgi:glycerol-3-phosphate dehydrogenase